MKHTMGEEANHSFMLRRPEDLQLLFERFYSPLCNYAYSLIRHDQDAEDVVQSLFIELWEKRAQYQIPAEPRFFLLRATKNRVIDHLRRQAKTIQVSSNGIEMAEYGFDLNLADSIHLTTSWVELLPFAIDQLPPKTREVLLLSRQEEKSYKEIAAALDISIKTVEGQMSRAFRLLREFFAEKKNENFFESSKGF